MPPSYRERKWLSKKNRSSSGVNLPVSLPLCNYGGPNGDVFSSEMKDCEVDHEV